MKHRRVHLALLFVVAMAAYANSFVNRFVWDDAHFIVDNRAIKGLTNVPRFFREGSDNLYRPLRATLYAVTYRFSGLDPIGYHLVGKTLNALTVCALYLLMVELFGNAPAAFWGALIFALHPVHTEKVTFITSTYDIPGDLLWLSAFLCYVVSRRASGGRYYGTSIGLFAAGLFFAENAAVLPLIVVLYDLTLGANGRRPSRWVPYFVLLAGYLVLRTYVLGTVARTGGGALNPDLLGNYLSQSNVILHYFRLLVLPDPLVALYEVAPAVPPYPVQYIAAGIAVAAMIATALVLMRKQPGVSFAVLWFIVVLFPNLNFIPTGTVMAERYLYLPSASLAFFLSLLFTRPFFAGDQPETRRRRVALIAACLAVAGWFAVLTIRHNRDWRDEATLWAATVRNAPDSYVARKNLANELWRLGRDGEVESVLREAIAIRPERGEAQEMLAEFYLDRGKMDTAETLFRQAMAVPHLRNKALLNIAVMRILQKRYGEAETILLDLLEKHPRATLVLQNYAMLRFEMKQKDWWKPFMAIYQIKGGADTITAIADGFIKAGDTATAKRFARIALSLAPDDPHLKEIIGTP